MNAALDAPAPRASMRSNAPSLLAAALTGFLLSALHLAWEATHGGVQSHHLLNRADLPAISNLWGLLVLPLLAALAAVFVRRRAAVCQQAMRRAWFALLAAFALGLTLSIAFHFGLSEVTAGLFLATLLSGLVVPSYRAEYLFGFVLGMMFTFGAVLPTLVALIAASASLLAHRIVYPALVALYRGLRGRRRAG